MLQLFIASFCDQTDIEGNGCNMTKGKKLKQQALLKLNKQQALLKLKKSKKSITHIQAPIAHLLSVGLLIYRPGFDPRSRQTFLIIEDT